MTVTPEELARRLRRAREACHMKQEDVARHLAVARSTIAQIEAGNRNVSSLELDKLAYLYGRDIREFLADEFDESKDAFVALFRRHPRLAEDEPLAVALREAAALGRETTRLERMLGIERDLTALPAYPFRPPRSRWDAIQQGQRAADEERRRLELGSAPLPDVADLLESQGVRTAQLELPEDVSGLTVLDDEIGVFITINNLQPAHSRLRRRFSYAHEYCHALLDREQRGSISRTSERDDLPEVRANAFAAALLMPPAGVTEFVRRLGKGRPSRLQAEVYDEEEAQRVQARPAPGSQSIQMHDVVLLAHHFGVSRLATLYRLKNLGFLSQNELDTLLQEEEQGFGKALQGFLDLPEPDDEMARNEFRHRFLALALEAYRRDEITRAKLRELGGMVAVADEELEGVLREMEQDDGESRSD